MNIKTLGTYAILATALHAMDAQMSDVSREQNKFERIELECKKWNEKYGNFSSFVRKICCLMNQPIPNVSSIVQGVIHVCPSHYQLFVAALSDFLSNSDYKDMLIDEKISLVQNMGKLKHSDYDWFLGFVYHFKNWKLPVSVIAKIGSDLCREQYYSVFHSFERLSSPDSSLEEKIALLSALALLK
jgi:hypothetical protein